MSFFFFFPPIVHAVINLEKIIRITTICGHYGIKYTRVEYCMILHVFHTKESPLKKIGSAPSDIFLIMMLKMKAKRASNGKIEFSSLYVTKDQL